jgi:hypothetical protein
LASVVFLNYSDESGARKRASSSATEACSAVERVGPGLTVIRVSIPRITKRTQFTDDVRFQRVKRTCIGRCEHPLVPDPREWETGYDLDQTMSLAMGTVIGRLGESCRKQSTKMTTLKTLTLFGCGARGWNFACDGAERSTDRQPIASGWRRQWRRLRLRVRVSAVPELVCLLSVVPPL